MPELNTVTDPNLPEPKGASTASLGQAYVSDGAGSGSWGAPYLENILTASANQVAVADGAGSFDWKTAWNSWWWNVDSSATVATSLSSGTKTDMTNDNAGADSSDFSVPSGVSPIWDTATNSFDFEAGGLELGDEVFVRLDLEITANTNNDTFLVELDLAHGDAVEFSLPLAEINIDTAGTVRYTIPTRFFIGSNEVLQNPGKLTITSDSAGDSFLLNGFYVAAIPSKVRYF